MTPVAADVALWDALEARKAAPRRRVGKAVKDGLSERQIQRQIVKALRAIGIVCAHVPNGTRYSGDRLARVKQSAALIADGVLVGMPDLLCIHRDGRLGFLEIKRPGGVVSAEQERVAALMSMRSVPVAFVSSLDEALATVKGWGW
jgi:hypothetical protein